MAGPPQQHTTCLDTITSRSTHLRTMYRYHPGPIRLQAPSMQQPLKDSLSRTHHRTTIQQSSPSYQKQRRGCAVGHSSGVNPNIKALHKPFICTFIFLLFYNVSLSKVLFGNSNCTARCHELIGNKANLVMVPQYLSLVVPFRS
jgi:hypothetical protein